jgi:hypothetical protein
MGEINENQILVEKPEGKRPLGRPKRRWKDNMGKDIRELRRKFVDWMHVAQGPVPDSL